MRCPPGSDECKGQTDQESGEGCSTSDLSYWFKDSVLHPEPPKEPPKPPHGIRLAQLPDACRQVLNAPDVKLEARK
jgi:penicillin-insensitive murein endopeptidase